MSTNAGAIVTEFWERMKSNDFYSVGTTLSDDFTLEWPQSNERIRGRDNFARMNAEYPANGPWQFTVNQMVASETQVVTDVSVTDGIQAGRALSFFTVADGKIVKVVEFWPEPFEAPENRRHLVEIMD